MPFGYIGQNQTKQQVKNSGVLSSFDISLLEKKGQAGGSLELIEEQTVTSVSSVNFTDIKENDMMFIFAIFKYIASANMITCFKIFNDSGSSFETSNYQYAINSYATGNSFAKEKATANAIYNILVRLDCNISK